MKISDLPNIEIASEAYEEILSIEVWYALNRHANSEVSLRFFKGIPDFCGNFDDS